MRILRELIETAGVLLLVALFCLLPGRWARQVGKFLGRIAYYLAGRERRTAIENVHRFLGLGGAEARRVARDSMRHAGAAIATLLRAPRVTRGEVARSIEIPEETRRLIEQLRTDGRGAVIATSHLGNWELLNLATPYFGTPPMTVIVRPVPNRILGRLLRWFRSRTGQRIIYRGGAVLDCIRRVRAGEAVAITVDLTVPPQSGAVAVPFFGLPAFTTNAVGYIAAMTGAPVGLAYLAPIEGGRYRLCVQGPVAVEPGGDRRESAERVTARITSLLEYSIREHPSDWAWWLKRWNIWPEGEPGPYPSYAVAERHYLPKGAAIKRD